MGYIVPTDAPNPNQDEAGFKDAALPMQRIEEYALSIDSKHALFLFDSCFSGSLFAISRAVPENISYKTAKPVRQFITAGNADETVPDKSIFRQQFIQALQGEGDINRDGFLTGTELGEFLQSRVINYSKGAQHPQYGKIRNPHLDKGDFVFLIPQNGDEKKNQSEQQTPPAQRVSTESEREYNFENRFWDTVVKMDTTDMYQAYLNEYPQGHFKAIAQAKIKSATKIKRNQQQVVVQPWIIPDSSHRLLTDTDLSVLSRSELWKARNEIYARNGYIFKSAKGKAYARSLAGWYSPQNPDSSDVYRKMNATEKENIQRIKAYEQKK